MGSKPGGTVYPSLSQFVLTMSHLHHEFVPDDDSMIDDSAFVRLPPENVHALSDGDTKVR